MTIFVNNTGSTQTGPSGSWGIGADGNDGLTVGAPKETFSAALTAVSNDENIIIFDGTYKDGDYTLASKTGIDIDPENVAGGDNVVIQNNNGSDDRVFASNTVTDNIRFGRLTIDAEGKDHCYRSSGTGITQRFIFDGTKLINFGEEGIRNHGTTIFKGRYLLQSSVLDTVSTPSAVHWDPDTSGQTIIFGGLGLIDVTGGPASVLKGISITPDAAVDNSNVIIEDGLRIRCTNDGVSTVDATGVQLSLSGTSNGYALVYIGKIDVQISGTETPTGVLIHIDTVLAVDHLVINKPTLENLSVDSITLNGGWGLNVGGEFDQAGGDTIGSRLLTRFDYVGGEIVGFDHGDYVAGITAHSYGTGTVVRKSILSRIMEGCSDTTMYSGTVINPLNGSGSQCLRFKECTGSEIEQNTVVITDVSFAGAGITEADTTVSSTGNSFINNNIIFPASLSGTPKIVFSSASVTAQATFENNHYFKGGDSFVSTDFDDQGTGRDLSGWQTNVESTAFTDADNKTRSNGSITGDSTLIDAGSVNAVAPEDFNGRFFDSVRRPVGAFNGDSSPLELIEIKNTSPIGGKIIG